ncbi:hypothetical protein F511_36622 [Dorcoceras hygrometricum]|uniref:Uncharacterized protein n=1 Tax=Dorcoceras hygrometricum TaxID=472368 RepID=A0A2Z7CJC1_9LAMI|nr:hypothetical protein F511_36622 [Dorcoceras hygrometricum]
MMRRRVENQQVACIQTQEKRRRRGGNSAESYSAFSRCYLDLAIAKRCRLHKLIRQRFALAMKFQQEDFAFIISADEATVSSRNAKTSSRKKIQAKLLDNQTQATAASSRELI